MRLGEVQQEYGDRVSLRWRAFPLVPDQQPGRRATAKTQEGRRRAAAEEPRARFVPPDLESALPASSVPALMAARCAERQGDAFFARYHHRLFAAHFEENLDIGRADVLIRLAGECGLDARRFASDYAADEVYQAVLHDCAEGAAWFGVSALPTVIFDERLSLVGAVPVERYRLLLDWILAGEPGGVIPLPRDSTASPAPGQSVIAGPGMPS